VREIRFLAIGEGGTASNPDFTKTIESRLESSLVFLGTVEKLYWQ
jgi:hypothetical protein